MAPQTSVHRVKKPKAKWSITVMMNAKDLSRDDDFLSHILVEHLGTDGAPLQVHKMDPSWTAPKHDPKAVMTILKKYIIRQGGSSNATQRVKRAVDALLELPVVRQYLYKRDTAQINAFATHASRYLELYLPSGSIEISQTSRYSHRTGKSELCILATKPLKVGQIVKDLKGSLAHLTAEEDEELKRTDNHRRAGGIRRDFSVIHSNQKNKSHLFLGPARFVNHDCDHNVELFRDGRMVTFRVLKPINVGEELTAHYGDGYFGKGNRHCLCQTCETLGRGGYAPDENQNAPDVDDDSSTDEETREERIRVVLGLTAKGNPNERRTRRGVYAILAEKDTDDEDGGTGTPNGVKTPLQPNGISGELLDQKVGSPAMVLPTIANLLSGNKPRSRRLSDASSSLTSLSASEKELDQSAVQPKVHEDATPQITPATSRRSTRASTASQDKGKAKADLSSTNSTPQPGNSKIKGTYIPGSAPMVENLRDRSASGRRSASQSHATNGNRGSASKSTSKSATPSAGVLTNQPVLKLAPTKPHCSNCLPRMAVSTLIKNAKLTCSRCKRHYAIFGSHWPDRTKNLPELSSSSESESDSEDELPMRGRHGDLKRRKTDSVLYASAAKVLNQKFLGLEGGHRYMAHRALSQESSAFKIGSKRKWEELDEPEYRETSIRELTSSAGLPVAKPLAALWSRPSPVLFARSAWTTSAFVDPDRPKGSKLEDAGKAEKHLNTATKSTSGTRSSQQLSTPSVASAGAKRKRESLPDDKPKVKVGKTFYMKDERKRRMPKGWVLLSTSSSSEAEEEEQQGKEVEGDEATKVEEDVDAAQHLVSPSKSTSGTNSVSTAASDSKPTSISSSPHSKTPTRKSDVLSDDQNRMSSYTPTASEKHFISSKLTRVDISPATSISSKRKKVEEPDPNSPRTTRSQAKRAEIVTKPSITVEPQKPLSAKTEVESPPGITFSGTTSESSVTTEQNEGRGSVTAMADELQNLVVSQHIEVNRKEVIMKDIESLSLPVEELKRVALDVSNYIHGTAYSFGHPDPRTSWKPKYRYSDVDGWFSDSEATL